MSVTLLRFISIMLVALSAGKAFCHLLEMPVRLGYAPELWARVTIEENTYKMFGPAFGAWLESAAWVSSLALSIVVRRDGTQFRMTAIGAALVVIAHVIWWVWVFPANSQFAAWDTANLPADFDQWRKQWEYAHGARAFLQITGLGFIVAGSIRIFRKIPAVAA